MGCGIEMATPAKALRPAVVALSCLENLDVALPGPSPICARTPCMARRAPEILAIRAVAWMLDWSMASKALAIDDPLWLILSADTDVVFPKASIRDCAAL